MTNTINIEPDQSAAIIATMGQAWFDGEFKKVLRPLTAKQSATVVRSLVVQCHAMLAARAQTATVARGSHLTVVK